MRLKKTYGILLTSLLLGVLLYGFSSFQKNESPEKIVLSNAKIKANENGYIAGQEIKLFCSFDIENTGDLGRIGNMPKLILSSSYGSTVLKATVDSEAVYFLIPSYIAKKSGWITYSLVLNTKILNNGSFEIVPTSAIQSPIESYLGPPSILAGGEDYSMLVVTATDTLDNLLVNDTPVLIREHFEAIGANTPNKIAKRIAWKRIYSQEKSGRLFVSATINNTSSKEQITDVFPNNAVDFSIVEKRTHPYADGNQIANLKTDQIIDSYGNVISDGTLVTFYITASDGTAMQTSGTTIDGVASAKLLHPDAAVSWKIQAFVSGIAESNKIELTFQSIVSDFQFHFSDDNRLLQVGPIKSYMNQIVAEGTEVKLTINNDEKVLIQATNQGVVNFNLPKTYFEAGTFVLTIETLGISKTITKILQ